MKGMASAKTASQEAQQERPTDLRAVSQLFMISPGFFLMPFLKFGAFLHASWTFCDSRNEAAIETLHAAAECPRHFQRDVLRNVLIRTSLHPTAM